MKISNFLGFLMVVALGCASCDPNKDNPDPDSTETSGDVLWQKELALPINPLLGDNFMPAVDGEDNMYVLIQNFEGGLWGGYAMQKFDKNGNELWRKESTEGGYTPQTQMPTFYQGRLYFTTDEKVVCLNAGTGDRDWEYNLPDSMLYITSAIAVVNSQLLITLEAGMAEYSYLFALDPGTGDVNGTLGITADRVWLNMAAKGNTVYLVSSFLYSVTVNPDGSMQMNWSVQLPGDNETYYISFENDMVISPDGNISFAYTEGLDAQLDRIITYNSAGEMLWEYERPYARHITLDKDGNVYDGGVDNLIRINAADGQKVWETEPPSETMGFGNSFTAMVHGANGVLYCGDVYGIYGVNLSGEVKYSLFPEKVSGSMTPLSDVTLLGNGNIIVLAMDEEGDNGHIYCVKAETGGIASKGWPKRGGNAANTFHVD